MSTAAPVARAEAVNSTGTNGVFRNGTAGHSDKNTPEYPMTHNAAAMATTCKTNSTARPVRVSCTIPITSAPTAAKQNTATDQAPNQAHS